MARATAMPLAKDAAVRSATCCQLNLWLLPQIFSSDAVNTGVGVYWMFYAGGSFEEAVVPAGMPGLAEGTEVEGLRLGALVCYIPAFNVHGWLWNQ